MMLPSILGGGALSLGVSKHWFFYVNGIRKLVSMFGWYVGIVWFPNSTISSGLQWRPLWGVCSCEGFCSSYVPFSPFSCICKGQGANSCKETVDSCWSLYLMCVYVDSHPIVLIFGSKDHSLNSLQIKRLVPVLISMMEGICLQTITRKMERMRYAICCSWQYRSDAI